MSGSDEYSSESKIGKITINTINTVLCFIQENIGSCSKYILLEAVIKTLILMNLNYHHYNYLMTIQLTIVQLTLYLIFIILKLESLFANFTNYNYKSIDLTKNNSINTTLDKPNESNKSNNVTYANVVNDNSNNNNIHSKNNYIKPISISSEYEFTNVINKNKTKYKKRQQKMYGSDLDNKSYI